MWRAASLAYSLNAAIETRPHAPTLVMLSGELDAMNAPSVEQMLDDVVRADAPSVDVDMTGVTFMDAAGLRVLRRTAMRAAGYAGQLVLCATTPNIDRVLDLAGFEGPPGGPRGLRAVDL